MYKYAKDADVLREIEETIRQSPDAFSKDGVVSVSAGYKAVGGWLTRKPAIVVTVERKADGVLAEQMLPSKFGPFAVDVRQASPAEILRARSLRRYAALAGTGRKEFTLPSPVAQFNPATAELMPAEASLADHGDGEVLRRDIHPRLEVSGVADGDALGTDAF